MKTFHFREIAVAADNKELKMMRRFFLYVQFFLFLLVVGSASTAYSAETAGMPSYGKGPVELIVFTDYFCPPCAMIETDLEPAVLRLLAQGRVKVTFVDVPGHGKDSVLYAKYFLFAAQGAPGYKNAMHARNILFGLAKQNIVRTDAEIEKAFVAKKVAFKSYDLKPVFAELDKTIKQYKIKTTPTCILKYSEADARIYAGTVEIRDNLLPELQALYKKSKAVDKKSKR